MKNILIVVDMQNDFITGALGSKEAQAILPNVVNKIKEAQAKGAIIFYTRDTHFEDYLSTSEGRNLPVIHCIKETKGWELAPEIAATVRSEDQIINKLTFGSIELAQKIKEIEDQANDMEVELIGVCTDICVVSNALLLRAYCKELAIQVDAACCAGVTPATHESALETMKMCQIKIIND